MLKEEYINDLINIGYTQEQAEDQYNEEFVAISSINIDEFTILESEFDEY